GTCRRKCGSGSRSSSWTAWTTSSASRCCPARRPRTAGKKASRSERGSAKPERPPPRPQGPPSQTAPSRAPPAARSGRSANDAARSSPNAPMDDRAPRPRTARRTHGFTESVIREMTRVANEYGAINLAQGFPDFPAPEVIKEAACEAIRADINQYAVTWGSPRLRRAIAAKYARFYGMEVDEAREITVT